LNPRAAITRLNNVQRDTEISVKTINITSDTHTILNGLNQLNFSLKKLVYNMDSFDFGSGIFSPAI